MMFSCRVLSLFLIGCCPLAIAQEIISTPESAPRHNQQTIEKWESQIKLINPESKESKIYVPGLMLLLQDRFVSDGLRRQAAITLGRIGKNGTDAIPLMVQLLSKTGQKEERLWLLKGLSLFGQNAKSATTTALVIVNNDTATITERRAAMELLSRIGTADQRTIVALTNSLQIHSTKKNRLSKSDSALLRLTAAEAITYLKNHGKSAIPVLNRLLQTEVDDDVRRQVVVALGAMRFEAEIVFSNLLEVMAGDCSKSVQDEAMYTIAKIGPTVLPSLIQLLNHKEVTFRRRVMKSVCLMGKDATPVLAELIQKLQDEDAEIRLTCAEAIWVISRKTDHILPVALLLLTNQNRQIRKRSAQLIISLQNKATPAIPHLKKLQQHPRSDVRRAASHVLRKLKVKR